MESTSSNLNVSSITPPKDAKRISSIAYEFCPRANRLWPIMAWIVGFLAKTIARHRLPIGHCFEPILKGQSTQVECQIDLQSSGARFPQYIECTCRMCFLCCLAYKQTICWITFVIFDQCREPFIYNIWCIHVHEHTIRCNLSSPSLSPIMD